MLTLRLQRLGKKQHPSYRLIVSEKKKDPQARHVEILGVYNPTMNPKVIDFKADRINYWLSVGAQTSATVHNLLVTQGILKEKKRRVIHISKERRVKLDKAKSASAPAAPAV